MAGTWQKVAAGKSQTIEMDMLSVSRSATSATAWSRVRLDRNVGDAGGSYDSIRALIQYDCTARRFTTLRRAYFNGDTPLREEEVSRQRANKVEVGSIDERLLSLACVAATKSELPAGPEPALKSRQRRFRLSKRLNGPRRCTPICVRWRLPKRRPS